MIHSFKDRRLEKFFRNGKTTAGIPSEIINAILCRLETLDNVQSERELLSNSLRYERLRMTSNRYSSIRVNSKEGANKQVISSQADSLIKISRIWADFFPANTSNQPI